MSRGVRSLCRRCQVKKGPKDILHLQPSRIVATNIIPHSTKPSHVNNSNVPQKKKKKQSRPNPFLNPLPKLLPRGSNIHKPRPILQSRIRVPTTNAHLFHLARFSATLDFPRPDVPLDGLQPGTAEHGADAEEEGGEQRFEGDVCGQVDLRVQELREYG